MAVSVNLAGVVGVLAAMLTSVPFGTLGALAFVLTAVPAALAGCVMGLVANRHRGSRLERTVALLVAGPIAVFAAMLTWLFFIAMLASESVTPEGLVPAVALSGATALASIPGTTLGAFVIEAFAGTRAQPEDRVAKVFRLRLRGDARPFELAVSGLEQRSADIRRAAVAWLGDREEGTPVLQAWVRRATPEELSLAALEISTAKHGTEDMLLELLERGDWNAQHLASRRLGAVGGSAALRALESFVALDYLGESAVSAVARIRERQRGPDAQGGRLSAP